VPAGQSIRPVVLFPALYGSLQVVKGRLASALQAKGFALA
jgi:hypothetical protein